MKKLYILVTNNGDWGGTRAEYAIASSEEEAAQNENYQKRIALGHDHYVAELDGNSLLKVLLIDDCDKYNCKLIITEKEKISNGKDTN